MASGLVTDQEVFSGYGVPLGFRVEGEIAQGTDLSPVQASIDSIAGEIAEIQSWFTDGTAIPEAYITDLLGGVWRAAKACLDALAGLDGGP